MRVGMRPPSVYHAQPFVRPVCQEHLRFIWLLTIKLALSANGALGASQFKATIQPPATENLAGPCVFELSIPSPRERVRAVWLTYDRGYDISRYYSDAAVKAFAQRQAIALILGATMSCKIAADWRASGDGHRFVSGHRPLDTRCRA